MAKFYGTIGYAVTEEIRPGVWEPNVTERNYYGELIRNFRKLESSGNLNDNINVANEISIVADPFAYQNFSTIKYVEFMDNFWDVQSIEPQYPRIILSIGGVYNGQRPEENSTDSTE